MGCPRGLFPSVSAWLNIATLWNRTGLCANASSSPGDRTSINCVRVLAGVVALVVLTVALLAIRSQTR